MARPRDGLRVTLALALIAAVGSWLVRVALEPVQMSYRIEKDRLLQSGGAGLGLSIALAIAQAHGGSIHVKSAVSKGSTFTIKLPLASSGTSLGQLRPAQQHRVNRHNHRRKAHQ